MFDAPLDEDRRIRAHRHARGLAVETLANACGLTPERLAALEAGEGAVAAGRLARLADALRVSVTEFFDDDADGALRQAETALAAHAFDRIAEPRRRRAALTLLTAIADAE